MCRNIFEHKNIIKVARDINVKGLLSANNGQAFPMILKEFRDAGYIITYKLLNAWEFGVPQKRERVIIVGFRDMEDFRSFLSSNL